PAMDAIGFSDISWSDLGNNWLAGRNVALDECFLRLIEFIKLVAIALHALGRHAHKLDQFSIVINNLDIAVTIYCKRFGPFCEEGLHKHISRFHDLSPFGLLFSLLLWCPWKVERKAIAHATVNQ